ncbi:hypothetical protein WICPIJ_008867 [Wickerhamomyces pijperi]|uniref:Uncharacterized protein n=1 Tax=Wickerhamomyces pijperi TaxID=599730 RepID=A0A9P8PVA7_WICPI|nr:hypothetical protein WICPIJ_008867 [Wickerhamomyces pijperi]
MTVVPELDPPATDTSRLIENTGVIISTDLEHCPIDRVTGHNRVTVFQGNTQRLARWNRDVQQPGSAVCQDDLVLVDTGTWGCVTGD